MFNRAIFAERLYKLRIANELTMPSLAAKLEVSKSIINQYEKGKCLPSLEVLSAIAILFNVSSDYLLGISNDPTNPTQYNTKNISTQIQTLEQDILNKEELIAFLREKIQYFESSVFFNQKPVPPSEKLSNHYVDYDFNVSINEFKKKLLIALNEISCMFELTEPLAEENQQMTDLLYFFKDITKELEYYITKETRKDC